MNILVSEITYRVRMIPFMRFRVFYRAFHTCLLYMFCVSSGGAGGICDFCIEMVEIHAVGFLKQSSTHSIILQEIVTYTFEAHAFYISKEKEENWEVLSAYCGGLCLLPNDLLCFYGNNISIIVDLVALYILENRKHTDVEL